MYARYQRYRWYQLRHRLRPSIREGDNNWDSNYQNFYQVNKCQGGCSPNSHCEWGVCECDEGFRRSWGACHNMVGGSLSNPSYLSPECHFHAWAARAPESKSCLLWKPGVLWPRHEHGLSVRVDLSKWHQTKMTRQCQWSDLPMSGRYALEQQSLGMPG